MPRLVVCVHAHSHRISNTGKSGMTTQMITPGEGMKWAGWSGRILESVRLALSGLLEYYFNIL